MWVLQPGGEHHLALKSLDRQLRSQRLGENLDDNAPLQPPVLRDEHARHSAAELPL